MMTNRTEERIKTNNDVRENICTCTDNSQYILKSNIIRQCLTDLKCNRATFLQVTGICQCGMQIFCLTFSLRVKFEH